MNREKYYLKDLDDGKVVGIFDVELIGESSLTGRCYGINSWSLDEDEYYTIPSNIFFHCDVRCQWDSCPHLSFVGGDYESDLNGDNCERLYDEDRIVSHLRLMTFIWEVIGFVRPTDRTYFGSDDSCVIVESILEGFEIEKIESEEISEQ